LLALLPALATAQPEDAEASMKKHRTAQGLSFRHPAAWQVAENQGSVVLVPDDAARDQAGQPLQAFIIGAFPLPADAPADVQDPRMIAQVDQEIAGLFPGLSRVGSVGSFETNRGAGAIYTFEGSVGGGPPMRLQAYLKLRGGQGLCVMYFAQRELASRFEAQALRIARGLSLSAPGEASAAASVAPGGGGDPALVRSWRWLAIGGSSSSTGGLYANDEKTLSFFADGSVELVSTTTISGGGADWSTVSEPSSSAQRGTYTASGGMLTIHWNNGGTEQLSYKIFEHEGAPALKLQADGAKPQYYQ
jgi:hypothetical protein